MKKTLKEKIKKVKMLALDVDGILTDGTINIDASGREIKVFNVLDGFGIVLLKKAGLKTAIISARSSPALKARAKDLKIDQLCVDAHPKIEAYNQTRKRFKLRDDEICFMGDDLLDIPVLKKVGFSVAVPNAAPEVKKSVDYVTESAGGCGAVREVIELILQTQGIWKKIIREYGL